MNTVTIQHLSIGKVLTDIDFELPAGACAGIVGVNGAGKSTLLGCLAGVLHPEKGRIIGTEEAVYLPEGSPLDAGVPVRRWLDMAAILPGWEPELAKKMLDDFDLPLGTPVDRLSLGQRVRFGVLLALGRKSPVYLLDDPFLGLDPVVRGKVEAAIAFRGAEATILVAAQTLEPLERLCTHLLFLDRGRQRVFDTIDGWQARFRAVQTDKDQGVELKTDKAVLGWEARGRRARWVLDDPEGLFEKRLREAAGNHHASCGAKKRDRPLGSCGDTPHPEACEPCALGLDEVMTRLVDSARVL